MAFLADDRPLLMPSGIGIIVPGGTPIEVVPTVAAATAGSIVASGVGIGGAAAAAKTPGAGPAGSLGLDDVTGFTAFTFGADPDN